MRKFWLRNKETFYTSFAILLVGVALLVAGHYDYVDEVITEMKNNGAYYELIEKHPNASEEELVKMYYDKKN